MASQGESGDGRDRASGRIWVEDGDRRRPFMRGIMVHSLVARGVPFEEAYQVANQIRDRLRGRDVVAKDEVAKGVRELLGEEPFADDPRPTMPHIAVAGDGSSRPFSKGVLSQSLLAAALDPNEAFDVAREIERELIDQGVHRIERSALRRHTFETLGRTSGSKTADRYLAWRYHQNRERPVILLLGGAAGVGKTSLALEVAHRLGIGRVLSTRSARSCASCSPRTWRRRSTPRPTTPGSACPPPPPATTRCSRASAARRAASASACAPRWTARWPRA
jgi:2-phosphoglycerate kinase